MVTWVIAAVSGRVTGTGPPNLFLVLGRHRKLLRGWLRFAGRLMPGGTLPRRETEIAIVRVAHLRQCTYELHRMQDLTDETWDDLRLDLDEREAIELVLLVGHCEMLATAITALRIPPDEDRTSARR